MTPLAVLHVRPAITVATVDADLDQVRLALRAARAAQKARDDRLTRAALAAARGRLNHLLDRRLELTR